jgi:hypothetical protein
MENVSEIYCIHNIGNMYKTYSYDRNSPLYSHPIHINHYITKAYKSVLRKKKEHCLGQTNDFNRSGAAQIRWSYQGCATQLGPTTTIFNDSQNATGYFRNSGGNLQICVDGAGAGKRLQVMIMGSRGA